MDSDSFQADLSVLRKLYTLLQINESGKHSALLGILDGDTHSFLKKLLDEAAKKIYEGHMKAEADNWRSMLGTNGVGQLEEAKEPKRITQMQVGHAVARIESLIPKLHRLVKHVPTNAVGSLSSNKRLTSRKTSSSKESNNRRQNQDDVAQLDESDSYRSNSSSWKTWEVSSSSSSSSETTQNSVTRSRGENDSELSNSKSTNVTSNNSFTSSNADSASASDSTASVAHRKEGMFRRLKNKLGVIFHHHHHHHHHHHPHPHDKSSDASISQSVWKKEAVKKKLRRTEKKVEAKVGKKFKKTEKKAETENKKRVRKVKKHPGHFRALLGGVMMRAIESRKRKLGRGPRGKKPNLRLKGGKLTHKAHTKLQLGARKGKARERPN